MAHVHVLATVVHFPVTHEALVLLFEAFASLAPCLVSGHVDPQSYAMQPLPLEGSKP